MLACGSDEGGSSVIGTVISKDKFSPFPFSITSEVASDHAYMVALDHVVLMTSVVLAALDCVVFNNEMSVILDTVVPDDESSHSCDSVRWDSATGSANVAALDDGCFTVSERVVFTLSITVSRLPGFDCVKELI